MTIKDTLNLQGNDVKLLEEGLTLFLETSKGRKLRIEFIKKSNRRKK